MPLRSPNGATFESFDACVNTISDSEDMTEEEARSVCGSFEEVEKSKDSPLLKRLVDLFDEARGIDRLEESEVALQKGDTIGDILQKALDLAASRQRSRQQAMKDAANRAGVTMEAFRQWLSGDVQCPDEGALRKATRELPVQEETLLMAGRADGCDYSLRKSSHPGKTDEDEEDDDDDEEDEEDEMDKEQVEFSKTLSDIQKVDEEKRLVGGTIIKADRPDADGTIFPSEVVEDIIHDFVQKSQTMGVAHEVATDEVVLVEVWTAKADFDWNGTQVQKGDALGMAKVLNDDLWDMAKQGQLNSFSIEGRALAVKETD